MSLTHCTTEREAKCTPQTKLFAPGMHFPLAVWLQHFGAPIMALPVPYPTAAPPRQKKKKKEKKLNGSVSPNPSPHKGWDWGPPWSIN